MYYNLFSMFDPMNKTFSLNYLLMMMMLMINNNYWMMKKLILSNKIIMMKNKMKSNMNLFKSIFNQILWINLMNILPMMYSNSHNITFSFNLTLLLWLMMMIFSITNNYNVMFMNFSPKKTSLKLILIINIIELNSMIFSIMSISMRLMINMMMGHLIFMMLSMKFMIFFYMLIELMIILIQTYIFITLNMINFNSLN